VCAHQIIHIHPSAPAQPALGAPCNGCGVCCLVEPCPLGQVISRKCTGACDALRWDEVQTVYRCGAITDTAGVGCDAHLNSQPPSTDSIA